MKLKRFLFDKEIKQVEIAYTARRLGHKVDASRMSLLIRGKIIDSAPVIRAVRDALLQLGVSSKDIAQIEELKGAKL